MQFVPKFQQSFIAEVGEMILNFTQKCKEARMAKTILKKKRIKWEDSQSIISKIAPKLW